MRGILQHRPSPAMVVACIALTVALSGTSYAAIKLPKNSVGTKQLKRNAVTAPKIRKNAVAGAKVLNNSITGADVNEATLAQVPSAATATNATSASSATTAGTANAAFSTSHDAAIALPNSFDAIATLAIPAPGNYVVNVKFGAFNQSGAASFNDDCRLLAGGVVGDRLFFDVDGVGADDHEAVALQLVYQFTAPGQVVLRCTDGGIGDVYAFDTKITAVQVAQLTNTPF